MARRRDNAEWSDPGLLVLGSLAGGPRHGYSMTADIAANAGIELGPGTLYGALARLEGQGLIVALPADGARRPYAITAAGTQTLRARLAALDKFSKVAGARLRAATA
ncbi:PadR family transcriptional regulator [Specibacter cremeus]|uniref:PadR family transcriptional regulator n=1 Tax=Specibacter cremeus TaxID=1629051 RepID=UPI000F78908B|nr:helix-turn-helix transcriptional regulator [Specibacter cremeus]